MAIDTAASANAYNEFEKAWNDALANGNWEKGGVTIRLSGDETAALEKVYATALNALPDSVQRARYHNGVAALLDNFKAIAQEAKTRDKFAARIDALFQNAIAVNGINLDAQKKGPVPTGINLSGVTNGHAAHDVLEAVVGSHLRDDNVWIISAKDGPDYKDYVGDKVRIVATEGNRIKALIDELFAKLGRGAERATFYTLAQDTFHMMGSRYESDVKFPDLLHYLKASHDKV